MITFLFGVAIWGAIIMMIVTIVYSILYLFGELLMGIIAGIYTLFTGKN